MNLIYAAVAGLFGIGAWICTQTVWQYQYILQYIFMFLSSIFICLVFLYQEEHESSKKYTIFTPANLIYFILIIIALVFLRNYKLSDWKTVPQSFWKLWVVINGIQGILLILYFKIRDLYTHA